MASVRRCHRLGPSVRLPTLPTSGLAASPDHELVVWVQYDRGSRNVWVAEGTEWRSRLVTRYEGDDGQEISTLHV